MVYLAIHNYLITWFEIKLINTIYYISNLGIKYNGISLEQGKCR